MGNLHAKTTHTVKLTWDQSDPLEKGDLIRGLSDVLPEGAKIVDLSVTDTAKEGPDCTTPTVKRTLTITYVTDMRDRSRW